MYSLRMVNLGHLVERPMLGGESAALRPRPLSIGRFAFLLADVPLGDPAGLPRFSPSVGFNRLTTTKKSPVRAMASIKGPNFLADPDGRPAPFSTPVMPDQTTQTRVLESRTPRPRPPEISHDNGQSRPSVTVTPRHRVQIAPVSLRLRTPAPAGQNRPQDNPNHPVSEYPCWQTVCQS